MRIRPSSLDGQHAPRQAGGPSRPATAPAGPLAPLAVLTSVPALAAPALAMVLMAGLSLQLCVLGAAELGGFPALADPPALRPRGWR